MELINCYPEKKMNTSIDFPSENETCQGRCIIEMQKILEPAVIVDFLKVIRDFRHDDKTATKLKNEIFSELNETVKLLNERVYEMILMVDDLFLNRRQRQTSFYRLCHKLARKGLPVGSSLPDESKCVCFSEENLEKFNVDPDPRGSLEFSSNLVLIKEALRQYVGELQCIDCGRLCQSGSVMSCVSDCGCSVPSVSSQHKVHEAILELCKGKDEKICQDSWYLTQLKRDANYYKSRSSIASDGSVNSFEVISSSNQMNFEDSDTMDNESLGSDFSIPDDMINDANNKFPNSVLKSKSPSIAVCSKTGYPAADIQKLSKNLNNKLKQSFALQPLTTNLTDASKKNNTNSQCLTSVECKAENVKTCEKKLSPAAVLRQSFSPYFDKRSQRSYHRSTKKNDFVEAAVCPAEEVRRRLLKLQVDSKLIEFRASNKAVDPSCKGKESNPTDSLKCSLNSYFRKEASKSWLLK